MELPNDAKRVHELWFPNGVGDSLEAHRAYWLERMRGGMGEVIVRDFSDLTERAATGALDGWATSAEGRIALLIVLDQFSRSVWAGSARAYAQDPVALRIAQEGLDNGHYAAMPTVWHKTFFSLPLVHCEGPDLLQRVDRGIELTDAILAEAPDHLRPLYEFSAQQPREHRKVIARFGRHPHRNAILGRPSTPEEEHYIAEGAFPHQREGV